MSKREILIVGAGGHARSCIDVIEQEGRYHITGLVGLLDEVGCEVLGYSVLGADGDLDLLFMNCDIAIVAVGQIKSAKQRIKHFNHLKKIGFKTPSIVSPMAYVSKHATIGEGTIVMPGATVNAGAKVGANCIINSHSLIEHDVTIGDHCHISTSAILNGNVSIGCESFVGSNASVKQNIIIGERSIIGMGQILLHDCGADTMITAEGRRT